MSARGMVWLVVCLVVGACAGSSPSPSSSPKASAAAASASTSTSTQIVLRRAPADLACDAIPVEYHSLTFHIDPAAAEQVSAVADTGVRLLINWAAGFEPGTAAERVVRDPAGQVVVADGDVLQVGQRLQGYVVCLTDAEVDVLLADPGSG
jgi:hypothetical protein